MTAPTLINSPEEYVSRAIGVIEHQLTTAKSPHRIARLESKLLQWKKALEILQQKDDSCE